MGKKLKFKIQFPINANCTLWVLESEIKCKSSYCKKALIAIGRVHISKVNLAVLQLLFGHLLLLRANSRLSAWLLMHEIEVVPM